MAETRASLPRIATGVQYLDDVLHGGLVDGSVTLIMGNPGAGKTTLVSQVLAECIQSRGDKVLYFTLSESDEVLERNLQQYRFIDPAWIGTDFKVMDLRATLGHMDIPRSWKFSAREYQKMMDSLRAMVHQHGAKRVVIDSITALGTRMEDRELVRNFIFELGLGLQKEGAQLFLITEAGATSDTVLAEEFSCDCIIRLDKRMEDGELRRYLSVPKMRGSFHSPFEHRFVISPKGIKLKQLFDATNNKLVDAKETKA